jgi:hypothetical protein
MRPPAFGAPTLWPTPWPSPTGPSRAQPPTHPAVAPAAIPAYPTPPAPPAAPGYAGLPQQYLDGLQVFTGAPGAYYGGRGAEKQAQQDLYTLSNTWQYKTGKALTPDDWPRLWAVLNAYRASRPNATMSDAQTYLAQILTRAPRPAPVAYLRTAEL